LKIGRRCLKIDAEWFAWSISRKFTTIGISE
jgi:hypothetical protein